MRIAVTSCSIIFVIFTFVSNAQTVGQDWAKRALLSSHSSSLNNSLVDSEEKKTSLNSDEQWQLASQDIIANGHRIYSIKMVDSNIVWMVSTTDAFPPPADAAPYVLKSLDGGKTWKQYIIPNTEGHFLFDISPVDANIAYVVANDEFQFEDVEDAIYKTEDGGETWNVVANYPYAPTLIHFFNTQEGWVLGGDTSNIVVMSVTADGGETWSHAGGKNWDIPEGRGLSEQDTTDRVATWGFSVNSVYETTDSVIIVGGLKSYWVSKDRGYNWEAISSPLINVGRLTSIVAIKDAQNFALASNATPALNLISPRMYVTDDGGENWKANFPIGHISAIQYLPGTENSYISVGHRNFGVGAVGTYRTDNLTVWRKVDDLPLIAMEFTGENKGVGALGNIPGLGDEGNVYTWKPKPAFNAKVESLFVPTYSIMSPRHVSDVGFAYGVNNIGRFNLDNVTVTLEVLRDSNVTYTDSKTINTIATDALRGVDFDYIPDEIGFYNYKFSFSQDDLGGTFFEDIQSFELSATTIAKDDGTMEGVLSWSNATREGYGYVGTTFELQQQDTLESILIAIDDLSERDATFYLSVYGFGEDGKPNDDALYQSEEILAAIALEGNPFYEYQLDTSLILPKGKYLFAGGQDRIQGKVYFSTDDSKTDSEDYWQISPTSANSRNWTNFPDIFVSTLGVRAKFTTIGILSNTENYRINSDLVDVFPIPFETQVSLIWKNSSSSQVQLQLYDIQGRLVWEKLTSRTPLIEQDFSALPNGTYFLKVTAGNLYQNLKIVKQ